MNYNILMSGQQVGIAEVVPKGLYVEISCRCQINGTDFYKVILQSGNDSMSLGTCLRENGAYVIHTRIPIRKLDLQHLNFLIENSENEESEKFIPIVPGKKFDFLPCLPQQCLSYYRGTPGIWLKDL